MELMPNFEMLRPTSLDEAVAIFAERPGARALGGGTDLVPALRRGFAVPETVVDLTDVAEIKGITSDGDGITIGAGVRLGELIDDATVGAELPILVEAASRIAGPSHRAAGTVGGNLCLDTRCVYYNQSEWWRRSNDYCLKYRGEVCHVAPKSKRCFAAFSADLPPALLALGAEAEVAGPAGRRRMPLADLYTGDGAAWLALAPDELVAAVHVPAAARTLRAGYRKVATRGSIDFPLVGVAVALAKDGDALGRLSVALTGVGARPILLAGTDDFLGSAVDEPMLESLATLVRKQINSMRTTLATPQYRRQVAVTLAQRLLSELAAA